MFAVFAFSSSAHAQTATIHGAVYEWNSFEPLENVIVEVNSTPSQSMLANYGLYSFNLDPGDYLISANYYSDSELVAYTEEQITITGDGDYVLDLILFPVQRRDQLIIDNDFSELEEIANLSELDEQESSAFPSGTTVIAAIILLVLIIAGFLVLTKQKKDNPALEDSYDNEVSDAFDTLSSTDSWGDLPDDLKEVIAIIAKNDGRITQKDLRTKVRHSEAKVSLMISDLESRGIVRKFRKGRGNIIILEVPDETDDSSNIESEFGSEDSPME